MKQKKDKPTITRQVIPYSLNQNECSCKIVKWHGNKEVRFDVILKTQNSYISLPLSFEQLKLLKKAVNEVV